MLLAANKDEFKQHVFVTFETVVKENKDSHGGKDNKRKEKC